MNDLTTDFDPNEGPPDLSEEERGWWRCLVGGMSRCPLPHELLHLRSACSFHALSGELMQALKGLKVSGERHLKLLQAASQALDAADQIERYLGVWTPKT